MKQRKNLDLLNMYVEKSANDLLIFSVFQAALLLAPPYLVKKTKEDWKEKMVPPRLVSQLSNPTSMNFLILDLF